MRLSLSHVLANAEVMTSFHITILSCSTISETASFIKHYFEEGELATWFSQLETLQYTEEIIYDDTHGNPHFHGIARLISRKPYSSV